MMGIYTRLGRDNENMDGFSGLLELGLPEEVSQESRWRSESRVLEIEPIEAVPSCIMTVCIAKREAEVGGRLDHCS